MARTHGVPINADLSDAALLQDLWIKTSDHPTAECRDLINRLTEFRRGVLNEVRRDPTGLIRWLYENQGERRFDSANRLFLVLINERNILTLGS